MYHGTENGRENEMDSTLHIIFITLLFNKTLQLKWHFMREILLYQFPSGQLSHHPHHGI